MTWSHNDDWLITGDDGGVLKYWKSNMNNLNEIKTHKNEPIRGISYFLFFFSWNFRIR